MIRADLVGEGARALTTRSSSCARGPASICWSAPHAPFHEPGFVGSLRDSSGSPLAHMSALTTASG